MFSSSSEHHQRLTLTELGEGGADGLLALGGPGLPLQEPILLVGVHERPPSNDPIVRFALLEYSFILHCFVEGSEHSRFNHERNSSRL